MFTIPVHVHGSSVDVQLIISLLEALNTHGSVDIEIGKIE